MIKSVPDQRRFGIIVTNKLWFDEAIKGWVKVLQFPPERKPRVNKLSEGDTCVIYLLDSRAFVGEFKVKRVKLVDWEEFKVYLKQAYEVPQAPFPRAGQKSWIILFDKIKCYPVEVKKEEIPEIAKWPLRGFIPSKRLEVLEKIRKLATAKPTPSKSEHDELIDIICQLGSILGYTRVEGKCLYENIEYDVIWWKRPRKEPTHIFEVQIRGNIHQALSKLKDAYDKYGSKPIFVAHEDDIRRARKIISGTFHEIEDKLVLIDVNSIREFFKFKKLFSKIQSELEKPL